MNVKKLKKQFAEMDKKVRNGETVLLNLEYKSPDGKKHSAPLKVNNEGTKKQSNKTGSARGKSGREEVTDDSTNNAEPAAEPASTPQILNLDLASIKVSDAEIIDMVEEANERTRKEIADREKSSRSESRKSEGQTLPRDSAPLSDPAAAKSPVPLVILTRDPLKNNWQVYEECRYKPDNDDYTLIAPKDYETDLASVPRVFWAALSSFELSLAAPLFHDLIYRCAGDMPQDKISPFPGKLYERAEVDKIFLELMTKTKVPRWKRDLAYYAVSYGAWWAWKKA